MSAISSAAVSGVPDVVGARDERLHQTARLFQTSGPRQRAHQPERAVQEAAFAARQPVAGAIAVNEVAVAERAYSWIGRQPSVRMSQWQTQANHPPACPTPDP